MSPSTNLVGLCLAAYLACGWYLTWKEQQYRWMDQTNQDTNYPACRCLEQAFILTTALLVLLSIYVAWGSWDQATVDSFDYSK